MLGSFFDQFVRDREFKIDELSAVVTDRVIVSLQRAIVSGRIRAEPDFAYQSLLLQIAERIVDGRKRDTGQVLSRPLKDLVRGQMLVRFADDAEHSPALFCKS